MKTIILIFSMFFVGNMLTAQTIKTQKQKMDKPVITSKYVGDKTPLIKGKKVLVKKQLVTDRKRSVKKIVFH